MITGMFFGNTCELIAHATNNVATYLLERPKQLSGGKLH
jgi:hypothetical protein